MADLADDIRALEEALAAGPTLGPWGVMLTEGAIGLIGSDDEQEQRLHAGHLGQTCREAGHEPYECGPPILWVEVTNPDTGEDCAPRSEDMAYIAAANPDRIRRVLDELEAAQDDAERLCVWVKQADARGDEAMRRAHKAEAELKQLRDIAARYHWLCAHLTQIHVETTQPAGSPADTPMRVTLMQVWPELPRTDVGSVDKAVGEAMKEMP